jgi:hypothetical protein
LGCHVMLLRLAPDRSSGGDAAIYVRCRVCPLPGVVLRRPP